MAMLRRETRSAEIRSQLDHPIIDADGHLLEFSPSFVDYLGKIGGAAFADRYLAKYRATGVAPMSEEERRRQRRRRGYWWAAPMANTLDAVTPYLPKLLCERMDTFGIDFSLVYPSSGLLIGAIADDEDRLIACRALNEMHAELYNREYGARLTVPAVLPMKRPEEAIAELEHVVGTLGFKAVMFPAGVWRPVQALHERFPGLSDARPDGIWLDNYGLDSEYDYDPVWSRCSELCVAATSHGAAAPGDPWGSRSISNWTFNHIGNQPWQQSMLCKSLYIGGVSRRHPSLNFAFLECGVAWACTLLSDTVSHWEKRNVEALANVDPSRLDRQGASRLMLEYGGKRFEGRSDQRINCFPMENDPPLPSESLDDFVHMQIAQKEDLGRLFDNFYFGCEADDRMNALAFATRINRFGKRLNAIFSSDIGHFDVVDMTRVVEEAYELVEDEAMTPADFRDFTANNPIRLHGRMNPKFFEGTPVEGYAAELLARERGEVGGD
jgi:predicted TIM-barrel fold metal-dependent hydrolase